MQLHQQHLCKSTTITMDSDDPLSIDRQGNRAAELLATKLPTYGETGAAATEGTNEDDL
jgi:hypothetical protein